LAVIQVQNLKKVFGLKLAVDGVSFTVNKGEVLGFLGPNGAGKSTTMRMITGFIPPSEGSVSIGGFDVTENPLAAKRLFGYLLTHSRIPGSARVSRAGESIALSRTFWERPPHS
jgi:ABC-type multidrug transport system ATPase subunit